MADRKRDQAITLRLSVEERQMLEAVADHTGLSQSDVIRQGIRRSYADAFGDRKPPRKRQR